jgi:4-diphosphocytidyl-2-C-methyl-D-erythritol kinase
MLNSELTLPAPAKLNLFLHICGRRDDGYHNLQTVFQFLTIADDLTFTLRHDGQIQLKTPFAGVAADDNLIVRAAKLLQQASQTSFGADISINKRLPMGAGIGGGSSNAATTLVGLNQLWQTNFSREQLQALGVQLGADVPIFIYGKSAWAEGVGEKLVAIDLPEHWYLLLIPDCHVSTKEIFSHKELTRDTKITTMATFLEQGSQGQFKNDCEILVRKLYPEVDQAFEILNNFTKAQMTGTGACVYAQFNTEQEARKVQQQLPKPINSLVTKASNISSLYQVL